MSLRSCLCDGAVLLVTQLQRSCSRVEDSAKVSDCNAAADGQKQLPGKHRPLRQSLTPQLL